MLQIYNRLLELPLFLGIGATDLAEIVRTTRFGFLKLKPKVGNSSFLWTGYYP